MKPTMMLVIVMIAAITLMTLFGITLSPTEPIQLSAGAAANALYVCPAHSVLWDGFSTSLVQLRRPLIIGFCFAAMILGATWVWALYQNLLKDKFSRDAYKNPWAFTKMLFWAIVVVILLMKTPNYFRDVSVRSTNQPWVLCENNTPGARPVNIKNVEP